MADNQYLDRKELIQELIHEDVQVQDLISSDTYNESKLVQKISSMSDDAKVLLQKTAIHIAIIGAGGKSFGSVRHNDKVWEITDIFKKFNIKYANVQNSKLEEDELTSRRLVRIYRYHIQEFIERTNRPSYFYLKYSTRNKQYVNKCFPGAEHIITTMDEYKYLYDAYKNLDGKLGTTSFVKRLERVCIARGILDPSKMELL